MPKQITQQITNGGLVWVGGKTGLQSISSQLFYYSHMFLWFSARGYFAPTGHLAISGDIFDCHSSGKGASGIQWGEARMLLNILQCAGPPTHNKDLPDPKCK